MAMAVVQMETSWMLLLEANGGELSKGT
jgi:hypothetical protein